MHDVIQNELEDYLGGSASRGFHAHLEKCAECRMEAGAMHDISGLFAELRAPAEELAPGFYFRVTQHVESRRQQPFWNLFAFDPGFARRVVFSSLMALALLGSYLVTRESGYPSASDSPAAIMAEHDSSIPHENGADRGHMLVTLASYQR